MATKKSRTNTALDKARKLLAQKGAKKKKVKYPSGQNHPQGKSYSMGADEAEVAKATGWRWTEQGAKRLGKTESSRPSRSDIEKYSGKTFKVAGKKNPMSDDGSFRYLYNEARADKSDLSRKNKLEDGGMLVDLQTGVNADPRFDIYNTTMFAKDGGEMAKGGKVKEMEFNDTKWYLTYDDPTHFFLSNSPDFKGTPYHVAQFKDRPFYNEIKDWLIETSRMNQMADGGEMAKGGTINMDRHVWEGWTVGDFIRELEIPFQYHSKFSSKDEVKKWAMSEQPYYKKYVPEVVTYYWQKNQEKYADGGGTKRPLYEIAEEIRRDWKNVNFGAKPYLDAMSTLTNVTDNYGMDSARSIVNYFLANASSWRGDNAKRIKAELKSMVKYEDGGAMEYGRGGNAKQKSFKKIFKDFYYIGKPVFNKFSDEQLIVAWEEYFLRVAMDIGGSILSMAHHINDTFIEKGLPEEDPLKLSELIRIFKNNFNTFYKVYSRSTKKEDGGEIEEREESDNLEMLKNQAKEFQHHAAELQNVLKSNPEIDAWVVAKAERATTDLSDITHYIDGLGTEMAKGGTTQTHPEYPKTYNEFRDMTKTAKPVGYRFTNDRADILNKSRTARPTRSDIEKYSGDGVYWENRADKSDMSPREKFADGGEYARGGYERVANSQAREYTENMLPFRANNLEGKTLENGDYVVLFYGYYPIWFYCKRDGKWYGNRDKFSVTTSKHMSQSRPTYHADMLSRSEMDEKMAQSIEGNSYKELGGTIEPDFSTMSAHS